MPRRPSAFSQADLARAIRAARSAGMTVGVVEVTPDGAIRITAAPAAPVATVPPVDARPRKAFT